MAVSNQLRTSAKVIQKESLPAPASGQQMNTPAKSGLDRRGISSAEALKGKKIKNLSLKGVSNY